MPLPPKELNTITEVACRWNVPIETVEDFLLTGKLQSSIFLPRKMMCNYTKQLDRDAHPFDDDPYIYDIDYDDPNSYRDRQGIFNLIYQDIDWDEDGQVVLGGGDLFLTLPDEEGYFCFSKPFVLNWDEVIITFSELTRFETEHGITFDDIAQKENNQIGSTSICLDVSSEDSILSISSPSQKDNLKDAVDSIDPRRERTLLILIAALHEIIDGDFANKDVIKHPSIKNLGDLIDKLADMETTGLRKRNLQGIFSQAKETKKRS